MAPKTESRLTLKDFPYHNVRNLAMMPGRTTALAEFRGSESTGTRGNINKLTMARLDAGDAAFVVENANHSGEEEEEEEERQPLLRPLVAGDPNNEFFLVDGRIEHVHAPNDCLPRYATRDDLELMPGYLSDLGEERPEVEKELATRCLYEGSIYEDGSQWEASHKKCSMCFCKRGGLLFMYLRTHREELLLFSKDASS